MAVTINSFSIEERNANLSKSGEVEYVLLCEGEDAGIRSIYYNAVFAQYQLEEGRYFVVLENDSWEDTNYQFYLLGRDLSILDCVRQFASDDCEERFIVDHRLDEGEFSFKKAGSAKKYVLKIDREGSFFYSARDLKSRSFFDFLRLKKYLRLTEE
ncbi:hypothetical protein JD974_06890 [Chromobacterium haemolyticum]|uniref:Uncharacterized protein n=1 Tax=Chromobacterium haemolyticum TaxID=394935 RepID=A0ABS3GKF0_9NEIS|nr:hypothetical protein [Chromobacterium haemolyticum]MBK0414131.1 hypothetical protein [Chromobacterium haemolyticum]MBO0415510.1 hypothetical protein [Chromobacterium haemolyticum]MBO0498974.1 hypothetical protein [Chromobacterium haemolyticum]